MSDIAKGEASRRSTNAAPKKSEITSLQTAVGANAALKAKLDAQSVATSDIVAANVEADGSVTVYVK